MRHGPGAQDCFFGRKSGKADVQSQDSLIGRRIGAETLSQQRQSEAHACTLFVQSPQLLNRYSFIQR